MPSPEARQAINRIIFEELVYGKFLPESLAYFQQVIEGFKNQGCQAVALSCTEIPLLVNDSNSPLADARLDPAAGQGGVAQGRGMKTVRHHRRDRAGIDGGLLPLDHRRLPRARPDGSYPAIIINSIDLNKLGTW